MRKSIIRTSLLVLQCINITMTVDAFQIASTRSHHYLSIQHIRSQHKSNNLNRKYDNVQLYSSPNNDNDDEQQELILSSKLSESLAGIGNEAGYLAAARKRNEEAKAKMMEQIRKEEEEAEARRQAKKDQSIANNFGPGADEMSSWEGFGDFDGFEESSGNDSAGGWSELKEQAQEEEEEPKLFLFGDENNDSTDSGLLL